MKLQGRDSEHTEGIREEEGDTRREGEVEGRESTWGRDAEGTTEGTMRK